MEQALEEAITGSLFADPISGYGSGEAHAVLTGSSMTVERDFRFRDGDYHEASGATAMFRRGGWSVESYQEAERPLALLFYYDDRTRAWVADGSRARCEMDLARADTPRSPGPLAARGLRWADQSDAQFAFVPDQQPFDAVVTFRADANAGRPDRPLEAASDARSPAEVRRASPLGSPWP